MDSDTFKGSLGLEYSINKDDLVDFVSLPSTKASGKRYEILKNRVDYTSELQQERNARKRLAAVEKKKKKDKYDIHELESELKEWDKKVAHLQSKEERLTADCKDLLSRTSMSESDSRIMNTLKKKFTLYKEISGLKWDFTCPANEIKGYVRNKRAGKTHYFNLTGKPMEKVWGLLRDASHADWKGIGEADDKENNVKGNRN